MHGKRHVYLLFLAKCNRPYYTHAPNILIQSQYSRSIAFHSLSTAIIQSEKPQPGPFDEREFALLHVLILALCYTYGSGSEATCDVIAMANVILHKHSLAKPAPIFPNLDHLK